MRERQLPYKPEKRLYISIWSTLCLLLFLIVGFGPLVTARVQAASAFTEYSLPKLSAPTGITRGPDGNVWFTEALANKIGKITPSGVISHYQIPTPNTTPRDITTGPDGNLWFTESGRDKIGRITPSGVITEYSVPGPGAGASFSGITAGPDGNVWFTEFFGNKIGKVTPAGVITEYVIPTSDIAANGITTGPDGNLWFVGHEYHKIGRITPAGQFTEYNLPTATSDPINITRGPDGNMWFTEVVSGKIGKVTTAGVVTEYLLPASFNLPGPFYPEDITTGPDGNLWYSGLRGKIGNITPSGIATQYTTPSFTENPGITAGPDGAIWFTEVGLEGPIRGDSKIGRMALSPLAGSSAETHVTGVVSQNGTSVANATVTVTCNGNVMIDTTGADGTYFVDLAGTACPAGTTIKVEARKSPLSGSASGTATGLTTKLNLAVINVSIRG